MRVVIVGAGDVGTYIAEGLTESHDIAVVDTDAERVAALDERLTETTRATQDYADEAATAL